MAERAKAKAKPKAKKKADVPAGATGSRGKVAKTKSAKVGHNSGKIAPEIIRMHDEKISAIEVRLKSAKAKLDSIKGEYRSAYAVVKQDGLSVEAFKAARELHKRDHGEVVTEFANVGEILAAIKSPLAEQLDLFQSLQPAMASPVLAGAAAFGNLEPRSNNPHKAGTGDYVAWDESWMSAANASELKDGEGQTIN